MASNDTKTVLITGSNRGFGLALATKYKTLGWRVIGTARNVETAQHLQALSPYKIVPLDVTDEASVTSAATLLLCNEPIDLLINNAGVLENADLHLTTKTSLMKQLEVNAVGAFLVTRAFLPNLQAAAAQRGSAVVAFLSSCAGSIADNSTTGNYGYRASKAALNMLHKSLSLDLQGDHITCVALHPCLAATDMTSGEGEISVEQSADGLVHVLETVTHDQTGAFLRLDGGSIPW